MARIIRPTAGRLVASRAAGIETMPIAFRKVAQRLNSGGWVSRSHPSRISARKSLCPSESWSVQNSSSQGPRRAASAASRTRMMATAPAVMRPIVGGVRRNSHGRFAGTACVARVAIGQDLGGCGDRSAARAGNQQLPDAPRGRSGSRHLWAKAGSKSMARRRESHGRPLNRATDAWTPTAAPPRRRRTSAARQDRRSAARRSAGRRAGRPG